MRVIQPILIDDDVLISSTVAEPDAGSPSTEPIYNAGTTYAAGDVVISTTTHRKYESLQAANTGNPLPAQPETTTAWWLDIGPTNRWAMFDTYRNTATSAAGASMEVVLQPGRRINSIALLGLEATSVRLEITDAVGSPATLYYEHTEDLNNRQVLDWYDYFFDEFSTRPSMVLFDLPPYSGAYVSVTITNTAGDAACGAVVIGNYLFIGETQHDTESDALNFSKVDRDEFGEATLVIRRSVPKVSTTAVCDKAIVTAVRDLRTALNAVPAVWSSLDDSNEHSFFEIGLILGIYRRFTINTSPINQAIISLELEEI